MTQVDHYCFGDHCYICRPLNYTFLNGKVPHRCPVCWGRGTMPNSFYILGDSTGAGGPVTCKSCINGIVYV